MTLYEGRIGGKYSKLMDRINRSLPIDIRLLPYDVLTNRAWAGQLAKTAVLSAGEHASILRALDEVAKLDPETLAKDLPADEDVHTLVERLVTEAVGDAGARIHTGRSRNDQVVCDVRMYTADRLAELGQATADLIRTLKELGEKHTDTLLPGTTHLQPAQPISLGFYLLSLAFALIRDLERIAQTRARTNLCPLGAGALAGSGFPLDRQALSEELGFDGLLDNALDAIGDRDFAQETATVCAQLCSHLSRYAELFIYWANPAFGYVRFSDDWSTGSSMMPQKRNPDAMELVRGKAARCIGDATTLMTLAKGLPPSYSKDLQEDKEPLFDALDTTELCVLVFCEAIGSATFDSERMAAGCTADMLATDLADALVEAGVPFRKAHARVAKLVTELESKQSDLLDLDSAALLETYPELAEGFSLDFTQALARRSIEGGTAPESVSAQAKKVETALAGIKLGDVRVPSDR
jgi:argininosuccinate lyase